jgi:hypothetical protein
VSRDYPFWENGNHKFRSLGDERSGLSMVETLKQSWTIRFKEATCQKINHIRKPGIKNLRAPWSRVRTLVMISPDEWMRFFQRISGSIRLSNVRKRCQF